MKKLFTILLFFAWMPTLVSHAQTQNPLAYLQQQCPKLTQMYKSELAECKAHYVFAVDVSLSMAKYETTVLPALEAFVKALPNGDRVTIIPFAKYALDNKMGFNVEINKDTRAALIQMLPNLYPHGADRQDRQYYDTDIFLVQQAIAKSIQQNSEYGVNLVVFISDLLHCPLNNKDRQFTDDEMEDMKNLMRGAKNDAENLIFALELPQSGSPKGYVLPQLQEVYQEWGLKIENQRVPVNGEALIRQWFDQQKDRIMFTKLQTIIFRENRANPIEVRTEIDIDGNVIARVKWNATKLYPTIKLDTVYLNSSQFKFVPNEDYIGYTEAGSIDAELELGQIKHKSWGFHTLADTLYFDVKLPVPYQNEINKLLEGRPGPLANATEYKERLIWTFIFSLTVTIIILLLLILYIILFFKAVARNNQLYFKGKLIVYDANGNQLDDTRIIPKQKPSATILVGMGGSPAMCRVDDAEWQLEIKKIKANPFLLFAKPYFTWKGTKGYVAMGKAMSGKLLPENASSVKTKCGPRRGEETHQVKIQYMK
jgi:hypothetical protein